MTPLGTGLMGGAQMMDQLEPLVAADQWIDPVQAQHRHLNTGTGEPVQVKGFESGLGMPIEGGKQHGSRPEGKQAGILTAWQRVISGSPHPLWERACSRWRLVSSMNVD
nr:hypothetical protein GCM10020185_03960 [Pseudomonas brassicacearum subsp. brassicacearum]